MKKLLLLIALLFSSIFFSQNSEWENVFKETKAKADSLGISNGEVETNLYTLKKLKLFRDILLLDDNYKDQERVKNFITNYSLFLPDDFKKNQISNPKLINSFYRDQEDFYYAKSALLLSKLLVIKAKEDVEKASNELDTLDESLIITLQNVSYPVEKYNKLTLKEKKELIEKIAKGYKYSE